MNDKRIETYLRKSTRGLWGKRREEVREELSVHIQGRMNAHLIGGLSEGDAVEKTLTELGHPTNVSAGMARLYTLPIVAGSGMVLAMCCAVVVVLLSGSTAQTLQMTDVFPSDECLEPQDALPSYCYNGGWTSIEKLKEALEPQGVTFKTTGINWVLNFPENKPVVLPESGYQTWFFELEDKSEIQMSPRADYFRISDVIRSLHITQLPISLEGWEKPILKVGDVKLEIDLLSHDFRAGYGSVEFYSEPIWWDVFNSIPHNTYSMTIPARETTTENLRLKVDADKGSIYGLASIMDSSKVLSPTEDVDNTSVMYLDVTQVETDGEITFRSPFKQALIFKSHATAMHDVGDTLLVRLSGDLTNTSGYVIIPPDQIHLE